MSDSNGATFKGPWWIAVVERTGSLGLVLIMLIGAYFLARDFSTDMRATWRDIHGIIQNDAKVASEQRRKSDDILDSLVNQAMANQKFLHGLGETISSRLDSMDRRIDALEANLLKRKEN